MVLRIACSLVLLVTAARGHYRADNEILVAEMPLPGKPAWSPDCPFDCREATWSPDGDEIAFRSRTGDGAAEGSIVDISC